MSTTAQHVQSTSHVSSGGGGGGGNGWLTGWLIGNAMSNNAEPHGLPRSRNAPAVQHLDAVPQSRIGTTRSQHGLRKQQKQTGQCRLLDVPRRLRQPVQCPQRLGWLGQQFWSFEQLTMKKIHCAERPDWKQTAEEPRLHVPHHRRRAVLGRKRVLPVHARADRKRSGGPDHRTARDVHGSGRPRGATAKNCWIA